MKQPMKQPLKQQVNRHFDRLELSEQQLVELERQLVPPAVTINRSSRLTAGYLAVAGMFFVAILTVFMLSQFTGDGSKDMPRLIAEEVVKNHLKLKPLDVKAGTINAIRGYFSKLEFMPVDSAMLSNEGMQLIGGRYCSLQGITAAQLRIKQGKNLQTLYQTQYLADVFGPLPRVENGETPLTVYARGIKVKIWVEKGLLFALTDAPAVNNNQE